MFLALNRKFDYNADVEYYRVAALERRSDSVIKVSPQCVS